MKLLILGPQQINIRWERRDQRPLSSSADVRDGILNIYRVQYADSGDYSCQGLDGRGEVLFTAIAHVRVVGKYDFKVNKSLMQLSFHFTSCSFQL